MKNTNAERIQHNARAVFDYDADGQYLWRASCPCGWDSPAYRANDPAVVGVNGWAADHDAQ